MNFDFTDDQQAIKRTANELLASRFKLERVRELAEAGAYDDDVWDELCELGWAGIFIDEEHGGQGLGAVELVILMEELGYALAPLPFLSNAAAGLVLQHAGSDEQKQRWLPGIASGRGARHGRAGRRRRRGQARAGRRRGGRDRARLGRGRGGRRALGGRGRAARRRSTPRAATRASLSGTGEPLEGDVQAGLGPRQRPRWRPSSSASPSTRWRWPSSTRATASSSTARSAPTRRSRTAARRCCSRSRARARAPTTRPGPPTPSRETLPLAASMAKAYASDAGWRVTASSLQVHGGIGFTWEHDLHFFLKRAKADGAALRLGARAPRAGRAAVGPQRGRAGAGLGADGSSLPGRDSSAGRARDPGSDRDAQSRARRGRGA